MVHALHMTFKFFDAAGVLKNSVVNNKIYR